MVKELIKNRNSFNLGGSSTPTSETPNYGENINYAIVTTVLDHKINKNNS